MGVRFPASNMSTLSAAVCQHFRMFEHFPKTALRCLELPFVPQKYRIMGNAIETFALQYTANKAPSWPGVDGFGFIDANVGRNNQWTGPDTATSYRLQACEAAPFTHIIFDVQSDYCKVMPDENTTEPPASKASDLQSDPVAENPS
jgi:hypothetical protein